VLKFVYVLQALVYDPIVSRLVSLSKDISVGTEAIKILLTLINNSGATVQLLLCTDLRTIILKVVHKLMNDP
jgi:hypothetical protein